MGEGSENYRYFGSVVIESIASMALTSRYSITAISQHTVVEFHLRVFASFYKSEFIIHLKIKMPMGFKTISVSDSRFLHLAM